MKSWLHIYIMLVGFLIGIMCTLSLPLIMLGVIRPDPSPWNWCTMYLTDFVFGLALLVHLAGFLRKSSWGRALTLITAGYAVFAFSQTALEAILDILGLQDAPIAQPGFILTFMLAGFALGAAMIVYALRYPAHWRQAHAAQPGGNFHDN